MTLTVEQRIALLNTVSRVEDGDIAPPRAVGTVGRFLRELGVLRARVNELVPHDGHFVRGQTVGPIQLTPLAPLRERIASDLLGEVASTIAVSEELAGVVNVGLWSKARSANRLRNFWLRGVKPVQLSGGFRWYAPRRVTPGTAQIDEPVTGSSLWGARCLKFVGEEFLAAPAAASYRWDSAFGPPDFRTLRIAALHKNSGDWFVVPASDLRISHPVELSWAGSATAADREVGGPLVGLLARDPWVNTWSILETKPVDGDYLLAHLITWADHRRELLMMSSPTASEVTSLQRIVSSLGYASSRDEGLRQANLIRHVAPRVRDVAAWARGLA